MSLLLPHFDVTQLSISQRQILDDQRLWPDSPHFNVGGIGHIEGPLNIARFKESIKLLVQHHPILSTSYSNSGIQHLVFDDADLLEYIDFSKEDSPQQLSEMYCKSEFSKFISLDEGKKLWKMTLIKTSVEQYLMVAKFHHIIMDGYSVALAFRQLGQAYAQTHETGTRLGTEPSYLSFKQDCDDYCTGLSWKKDQEFWRQKIHHYPQSRLKDISSASHRPQFREQFPPEAIHHFSHIPPDVYEGLNDFCRSIGLSTYHLYGAAVIAYFSGLMGTREITIGVPVLNRGGKKYKQTLGMFAQLIPIKIQLNHDVTAAELMLAFNKELKQCYRHAKFPLGEIIRQIPEDNPGSQDIFDIIISYELHDFSVDFGQASLHNIQRHFSSVARYPFTYCICEFHKDDPTEIAIEASGDVFDSDEVAQIQKRLQSIVESIVKNPNQRLSSLELVTTNEKNTLLACGDSISNKSNETVIEQFLGVCKSHPQRIAISSLNEHLTYEQLHESVLTACFGLIKLDVGPSAVIALLTPRSPRTIATILAIARLGASYVLLDGTAPIGRNRQLIDECSANLVILGQNLCKEDFALPKLQTVFISALFYDDESKLGETSLLPDLPHPQNVAYILFTSGSTGIPKGVRVSHYALQSKINWLRKTFEYHESDVFLQSIALTFDPAQLEIFLPLTTGACCALAPDGVQSSVELMPLIETFTATSVIFVPTTLKYFLKSFSGNISTSLRLAICGGEQLHNDLAQEFIQRTSCRLYNFYGPTEACIFSAVYEVISESTEVNTPIGNAVDDTRLYVLDRHQRLVPQGLVGELYIGGNGLADGYIQERQTREYFVSDPFVAEGKMYRTGDLVYWDKNLNLCYVSRVDNQIKRKGVRIEPGEIEHTLLSSNLFINVAVLFIDDRLLAYVQTKNLDNDRQAINQLFSDGINDLIPRQMIPDRFIYVDHMPQSSSGKIDYRALASIKGTTWQADRDLPVVESELEHWLRNVWSQVLKTRVANSNQGFLDIGGDSLTALQIIVEVEHHVGVKLPMTALLKNSSIRQLVEIIEKRNQLTCQNISGHEQGQRIYFTASGHGDTVKLNRLANALGREAHILMLQPMTAIENQEFESLGNIIVRYCDVIESHCQGEPVLLAGYSLGGTVAVETARNLMIRGNSVKKLLLIDSIFPNRFLRSLPVHGILSLADFIWTLNRRINKNTHLSKLVSDQALKKQLNALKGFEPTNIDVSTTLFISKSMAHWKWLLMNQWHRVFIRHFKQVTTEGGHSSILDENVAELAKRISLCLQQLCE